jgi:hypothetical protein
MPDPVWTLPEPARPMGRGGVATNPGAGTSRWERFSDPDFAWLLSSSVEMIGHPSTPAGDYPIFVTPGATGGAVDETLGGLNAAVSDRLALEHVREPSAPAPASMSDTCSWSRMRLRFLSSRMCAYPPGRVRSSRAARPARSDAPLAVGSVLAAITPGGLHGVDLNPERRHDRVDRSPRLRLGP